MKMGRSSHVFRLLVIGGQILRSFQSDFIGLSSDFSYEECAIPGIVQGSKIGSFFENVNKDGLLGERVSDGGPRTKSFRTSHPGCFTSIFHRPTGRPSNRVLETGQSTSSRNSQPASVAARHVDDERPVQVRYLRELQDSQIDRSTPGIASFLSEYSAADTDNRNILIQKAFRYLWEAKRMSLEELASWIAMFSVSFRPSKPVVTALEKANVLYGFHSLRLKYSAEVEFTRYITSAIKAFNECLREENPRLKDDATEVWVKEIFNPISKSQFSQTLLNYDKFKELVTYNESMRTLKRLLENRSWDTVPEAQEYIKKFANYATRTNLEVSAQTKTLAIVFLLHLAKNNVPNAGKTLIALRDAAPSVLLKHDHLLLLHFIPRNR